MSTVETTPTPLLPATPPPSPAPSVGGRIKRFELRRDGLKWFAVLGGLLLLNLLIWFLFVRPVQREIKDLNAAKETAAQTERSAKQQLEAMRDVYKHVTEVRGGIKTFYSDMLSTKRERIVPFQRALVKLGRDFDVEPERVSVGLNKLEDEGLEEMAFNFPLTGGYENLRQFLAALEQIDQFLIVRGISLSGAKEGGSALQLNVEVATYFDAPEVRELKEKERADQARRRGSRRTRARRS